MVRAPDRLHARGCRSLRAGKISLAAILVAAALSSLAGAQEAPDQAAAALLDFIPEGADVVGCADVAAFRAHPRLLELRDNIRVVPGLWRSLDEFLRTTGLGLEKDVHRFAFGGSSARSPRGLLLVIRGGFRTPALQRAMERGGWRAVRESGLDLLLSPAPTGAPARGAAARPVAACFPDRGTVLWGSKEWVVKAGRLHQGSGSSVKSGAEIRRLIGAMAGGEAAWCVAEGQQAAQQALRGLFPQEAVGVTEVLGKVERLTLSIDPAREIRIHGLAEAAGEGEAGALADALRAAIALAKLQVQADPLALAALRSVRVAQDGREVAVEAALPQGLIREPASRGSS